MDPLENILNGRRIILGVSGSIAAYKACTLASLMVKAGADVYPVLTRGGARFVTPETFAALCDHPAVIDEFERPDPNEMTHIALAQSADAIVVAPASANLIARLATGMANDMLTLLLLATRAPILLAPAMNSNMWTHPMVAHNVETLIGLGYRLVEPTSGRMACGTVGPGKLAEPEEILEALKTYLRERVAPGSNHDFEGCEILVTAGPTREPIDAVRFLGNRSSGKMGYAIAEAALARGAKLTLVTGPTSLSPPAGAEVVQVQTAAEMLAAVEAHASTASVVIGAAAVADFTVDAPATTKIKRGEGPVVLTLRPTTDILAEIGKRKGTRILVGFAAEVGNPLDSARAKLASKNLDLIVANDVTAPGAGFNVDTNRVSFIDRSGAIEALPLLSKREVADRLLDRIRSIQSH